MKWLDMISHLGCAAGVGRGAQLHAQCSYNIIIIIILYIIIIILYIYARQAWDVEHNFMHHYELGEASDPDLVERNTHRRAIGGQLPPII